MGLFAAEKFLPRRLLAISVIGTIADEGCINPDSNRHGVATNGYLAKSPITVIYYSVVQLIACDNLLLGAGDEYGPCRFHESDARHQA